MQGNERKTAELSAKQVKAIECLLSEPTTKAAAKAAGVSEVTLWRWVNEPTFATAYRKARAQLLDSALTALQAASSTAVQTLRDVMNNRLAKPSEKVSAARVVLEFSLKGKDALETEERLRALEEQVASKIKEGRANE